MHDHPDDDHVRHGRRDLRSDRDDESEACAMKLAVRESFLKFNEPLEGAVPWMYQDLKGLVSIGIGMLLDPWNDGIANLPFLFRDNAKRMATHQEIREEWDRVKNLPPDKQGRTAAVLGHLYAFAFTSLVLPRSAIDLFATNKLAENDRVMKATFRDFEGWPADAQLGVHSMCWAVGPHFQEGWPKFTAALHARDWVTASIECFMPEETKYPGLRPRNRHNKTLFLNARVVDSGAGYDPDVLYWPRDLYRETSDTPTSPVLVPEVRPDPIEAKTVVDFDIVHPKLFREPDHEED